MGGGQDVVCVRQTPSSTISAAELKVHLEDLGDILFSDERRLSPLHQRREGMKKVLEVFLKILQLNNLQLCSYSETSRKDGLTVICSKKGGNIFLSSHPKWLQTVSSDPDAISFKFVPITSLLTGIPGSGYLSHAINLYLRYKSDPEYLQYFLEFRVPRQWAPAFNELALGPHRRKVSYPSLQFRFGGPKLHVDTIQEGVYQWILRQHEEGSRVTTADIVAHIQRDAATAPNVGDRVPYVIIKAAKGVKAYEKSGDPIFVLENNIPIDTQYYLENQISKPLLRLFEPILGERSKELFHGSHTSSVSISTPSNSGIMKFAKKQLACLGCKTLIGNTDQTLCSYCKGREAEIYCKTVDNVSELEMLFGRLWTQCQKCQGSLHQDVLCTSRDCPIFYRRKKAQKDKAEAKMQLERWDF